MPLIPSEIDKKSHLILFANRAAKAWQNYFDTRGLIPGIEPTREQIAAIQQDEKHLLINGSAGSGKSITLLYKLIKVMEQEKESQRILYVSYSPTLIDDAKKRLWQSERFRVAKDQHRFMAATFHWMATQVLKKIGFHDIQSLYTSYKNEDKHWDRLYRRIHAIKDNYENSPEGRRLPREERFFKTHDPGFLLDEILWMKANGYITKEAYLKCERSGRSINPRLTREQRKTVFRLYEIYRDQMKNKFNGDLDSEDYALLLLHHIEEIPEDLKFDHIFVDEVQDLQPMQIRALVKLAKKTMTISGDPKQRIYKRSPHSYNALGLDIQGRRNRLLKKNFRSTKQIMALAASIQFLDTENDRADGQIFVREGPKPEIRRHSSVSNMTRFIIGECKKIRKKKPGASIAVIHRYNRNQLERPNQMTLDLGRHFELITADQYGRKFDFEKEKKPIYLTDAFSIKGLEFDFVFILQFDRFHYPDKGRIEELDKRSNYHTTSDTYLKDEDDIHNDEKKILYVALTRARKQVWLLYNSENPRHISPFVRDFNSRDYEAYGFKKSMFK
jgi:superfamily I DNA/RNA helicase